MRKEDNTELKDLVDMMKSGSAGERAEAAKSLGLLGDQKAETFLVDALKDEDEIVRSNAALALGQISDNPMLLIDTLHDDSWLVRHDGVIALGQMNPSDHMDKVIPLTKDEVPDVREQAIRTLAKIGGKKAIKVILEYTDEVGPQVEVAEALEIINTEETIDPLIEIYKEGDQHVREIAVRAMGRYQSEEIIDTLIAALEDNSWRIREESVEALGSIEHEKVLPSLYKCLKDKNNYVIEKALKGIGKLGDETDVEKVKCMLEHEEAAVRAAASKSLGALGGESAIESLISTLSRERNPMVVWSIADALGMAAKSAGTSSLKKGMKRVHDDFASVLAVALGIAGETSAVDKLLNGMVHSSWKFRQKSVETVVNIDLSQLNDAKLKRLINTLFEALSDTDRWVRASAATVLGDIANRDGMEEYREDIEMALLNRLKKESDEDVIAALNESVE